MDILETTRNLSMGDVDAGGRLKPSALFQIFQDAGMLHAEKLGVGAAALLARGQGWILYRFSVRMDKRPGMDSQPIVRTWPRGCQHVWVIRDYELEAGGVVMARARSDWLVLDMTNRHPLRPAPLVKDLPLNEGRDALPRAEKLPAIEGLEKVGERAARYSDIDEYGHVNNGRYVQWAQDLLDGEKIKNAAGFSIDVNYTSEIKPNDTIGLYMKQESTTDGERFFIEGKHKDGQVSFRLLFGLKN